jgi:hypothetical protein
MSLELHLNHLSSISIAIEDAITLTNLSVIKNRDKYSNAVYTSYFKSIENRLGIDLTKRTALECNSTFTIATESIGYYLSSIWEAVKKAFKYVWNKIIDFIDSVWSTASKKEEYKKVINELDKNKTNQKVIINTQYKDYQQQHQIFLSSFKNAFEEKQINIDTIKKYANGYIKLYEPISKQINDANIIKDTMVRFKNYVNSNNDIFWDNNTSSALTENLLEFFNTTVDHKTKEITGTSHYTCNLPSNNKITSRNIQRTFVFSDQGYNQNVEFNFDVLDIVENTQSNEDKQIVFCKTIDELKSLFKLSLDLNKTYFEGNLATEFITTGKNIEKILDDISRLNFFKDDEDKDLKTNAVVVSNIYSFAIKTLLNDQLTSVIRILKGINRFEELVFQFAKLQTKNFKNK